MDDVTSTHHLDDAPAAVDAPIQKLKHLTCSICERRLRGDIRYVEETGDVPEPKRSWVLCATCDEAVHVQLDQSPVRTPVRLRVAVGLVAAERSPDARRTDFGQMTDEGWAKLFLWLFPITMLVHLAVIVIIAGLFK
jgi:hypothetical protein